jgi:hypothetical protein
VVCRLARLGEGTTAPVVTAVWAATVVWLWTETMKRNDGHPYVPSSTCGALPGLPGGLPPEGDLGDVHLSTVVCRVARSSSSSGRKAGGCEAAGDCASLGLGQYAEVW